jgi:hypothetical protein
MGRRIEASAAVAVLLRMLPFAPCQERMDRLGKLAQLL